MTRPAAATAETVPVIPGFHPDPSVCRVGDDYYLVNSSFEYVPAVPIWHSRDLVNWTQLGNALTRETQFPAPRASDSGGIYAPTLRHHDGCFWLITSDVGDPHGGHRLFRADAATGPWSDAIELPDLRGIDPDLTFTDDGECLVTYCSWQGGPSAIWQAAIDPRTGRVLEPPRLLWGGTDLGHADLVTRPDGTWAAVHLGVPPRGMTPSFHVNGRETFLAEVDWVDDWPVFRASEAQPPGGGAWDVDDRFDGLRPRWVSPRARLEEFTRLVAGGLEVHEASGSGVYARLQAAHWTATFELDPLDDDTVVHAEIRYDDRHRVGVRLAGGRASARWTVGGAVVELGGFDVDGIDVEPGDPLEIASVPSATGGPDDLVLSAGGRPLGSIDGRYLSTEVAAGFTGRVAGVRVERGRAVVHRIAIAESRA